MTAIDTDQIERLALLMREAKWQTFLEFTRSGKYRPMTQQAPELAQASMQFYRAVAERLIAEGVRLPGID